ncbi:MAG: protein tyrosine phosphatase, partial [Planctomycetota bacterium]
NDDRILVLAIECLESLLRNKYRTLVACGAGMSRSVVIAASALSIRTDVPLDLALKNVTMDAPRDVSPGLFKSVIRVHEQIANKI